VGHPVRARDRPKPRVCRLDVHAEKERGGVPRYGHLSGLHNVQAGKRLEVLPYTVSRAEYIDRGLNPYKTGSEYSATAGLDLVIARART
jgi:hypothetical protein